MKTLIDRLLSPTPEFHAKLRNLMIGLVTIISVLLMVHPAFIPEKWYEYLQFAVTAFASMGIYAQTTSTKH